MGLPSVFFVALLAVGGFWWTIKAPDSTGNLAAANNETIPRGCLLDAADWCDAAVKELALTGSVPSTAQAVCDAGGAEGFVELWKDATGGMGLRWNLPSAVNAVHPLASPWIVAWVGEPGPGGFHVANVANGWAMLPDSFSTGTVTAWAGSTGLGGDLREGLESLRIEPFAADAAGTPRLAAHINDDAIILEVPATDGFDFVRSDEELRFTQWTTGALACDASLAT